MRLPRTLGFPTIILALSLLASACGSSSTSSASGVDPSKKLTALTDAEKGTLCDWMVARAGSYGNPGTCDRTQPAAMSPFLAYDDQAACVADFRDPTYTACQATVAQMEACVKALPTCATLTDASNATACASLSGC